MFPSKIKSFLIFLIFPCYVFNQVCTYQNSTGCNNHGKCTKSGTCLCDLYYYGVNCESCRNSYNFKVFYIILKKLLTPKAELQSLKLGYPKET